MQQVVFISLKFQPSPTIWDHACVVSTTTVFILLILEINARATNNLVDDDQSSTIDDERSTFSHQWKFANKDFLLLNLTRFFIDPTASHVHLRCECRITTFCLLHIRPGTLQAILAADEVELQLAGVIRNG